MGDGERVFSGFVGARTRKIVAMLGSGETLVIVPAPVKRRLRQANVWLRGVRTFMEFYPVGASVRAARLFDRNGRLIAEREGVDGQFDPAIG